MIPDTRVLVAEDSPFLCRLLASYLKEAGGFDVVGTAHTGREAIDKYRELAPDIVALDLTMPDLDGPAVLREIIAVRPAPVVIITGASGMDAVLTLRALEAGATDFVMKFDPSLNKSPEAIRAEIIAKMRRAARKVTPEQGTVAVAETQAPSTPDRTGQVALPAVVVIGASTGGPGALRQILSNLPGTFPGSIVIVQHVPAAFSAGLAADLGRNTPIPVAELRESERLAPGQARVAPGGNHLFFEPNRRVSFRPHNGEPNCPSIDWAMESAAAVYGQAAIGVLLSGMGSDGAIGLDAIRMRGGRTFVQDPATCVVAGMPGAALARGVGDFVGAPIELAAQLARLMNSLKGGQQ